jgi:hypothetical protein
LPIDSTISGALWYPVGAPLIPTTLEVDSFMWMQNQLQQTTPCLKQVSWVFPHPFSRASPMVVLLFPNCRYNSVEASGKTKSPCPQTWSNSFFFLVFEPSLHYSPRFHSCLDHFTNKLPAYEGS